jgi:hypothetical protein
MRSGDRSPFQQGANEPMADMVVIREDDVI